jgi:tetratricopeptide (TPR) repeat protein
LQRDVHWASSYRSQRVFAEEGLSIYRELGHQDGVARALNHLGQAEFATGNYALAESYYREGLQIAKEDGKAHFIAWSFNNLGNAAHRLGDYERAKPLLEESLRIRRDLGVKSSVVVTLINLGSLETDQGDLFAAQQHLEESLILSREVGGPDFRIRLLRGEPRHQPCVEQRRNNKRMFGRISQRDVRPPKFEGSGLSVGGVFGDC